MSALNELKGDNTLNIDATGSGTGTNSTPKSTLIYIIIPHTFLFFEFFLIFGGGCRCEKADFRSFSYKFYNVGIAYRRCLSCQDRRHLPPYNEYIGLLYHFPYIFLSFWRFYINYKLFYFFLFVYKIRYSFSILIRIKSPF